MSDAYDYSFKFLIVGKSGVGKTSLFCQYDRDKYPSPPLEPTDGVNIRLRTVEIDDKVINLHIWDSGGIELFHTLTAPYHRGANGVILVYDITDQESFADIKRWLAQVGDSKIIPRNVSLLLVGNKSDLESKRLVQYSQGKELADEHGIPFLETSATVNSNVEQAFISMVVQLKSKVSCAP